MRWLSDTGKLLLIAAGLVALLDVVGPEKVQGWSERAQKRHDDTNKRWAELNAARPDQAQVTRVAMWAASTPPDTPAGDAGLPGPELLDGLSAEDLLAFRREAWTAITAERRYSKANLRDPRWIFPFFEDRAYELFKERLPEPRRAVLRVAYRELQERMRRWRWMRLASQGMALPATAGLAWWLHARGYQWPQSLVAAFLFVGVAAFGIAAALVTPRFVAALLRTAATVRLGLARAATRAMGDSRDARPLRTIALGVFIVGSLLDLIGGW